MKTVYDYSKLLGRMREKRVTQVAMARELGVSETTLNWSLGNKRAFKQDEMLHICQMLGLKVADIDKYFFCQQTSEI